MTSKNSLKLAFLACSVAALSGCIPSELVGSKPGGGKVTALYYPGAPALEDLLIIGGTNYFGKAQYQMDDPVADIGFRFKSGERFQAECTLVGKNIIGDKECKRYTVVRSTFPLIPEKTVFPRPAGI